MGKDSTLSREDARRVFALAIGAEPKGGMEAHFLRVMNGKASPASERERAWLAYYQKLINDGVLIDPEDKVQWDASPLVAEEEPTVFEDTDELRDYMGDVWTFHSEGVTRSEEDGWFYADEGEQ